MRLKNLATLRERAAWHTAQDHVRQQTYGNGQTNGHTEFHACAIGCLAHPHTLPELSEMMRDRGFEYEDNRGVLVFSYAADYSEGLIDDIEDEFGVCAGLLRIAEAIFEHLPFHGGAIEWVAEFANALPEGADIDDLDAQMFWEDRGNEMDTSYDAFCAVWAFDPDVEDTRDAFVEWLKARAV